MACFFGHAEIVRELILRGARVNFPDNRDPSSPLSMAIRGGKTAVVKLLIEFGANLPPDMGTGLSDDDIRRAKLKAQQLPALQADDGGSGIPVIEEIQVTGCYGTDTSLLDAEMRQTVENLAKKKN